MDVTEHLESTRTRLSSLRYEIIDLEQILILLTGLEIKNKDVEQN